MDEYKFDREFEASIVRLLISDRDFFGRFGKYLLPSMFTNSASVAALKAATAIAKDAGRGPKGPALVYQRIQRWADEGKVRENMLKRLDRVVALGNEVGLSADEVAAELTPVLQTQHRHQAVEQLIKAHGRGEDLTKESALIRQANSIGLVNKNTGIGFGKDADSAIKDLRGLERFPVGIDDLDEGLGGGVPRSSLTIWVGGPGDGKSMALSQLASVAALHGMFVVYVTLEIPVPFILARMQAAITGFSIDEFLAGDRDARKAMKKISGSLGPVRCLRMEPGITTANDINDVLDEIEQEAGRAVDVLVVDYLDRMVPPSHRGTRKLDISSYAIGEMTTSALLDNVIIPRGMWGHTATQSVRGSGDKKRLKNLDDMADSAHKGRIADNVFTLNTAPGSGPGERLMTIRVSKHRTGLCDFSVGPYPADYGRGRIALSSILDGAAPGYTSIH